MKKEISTRDDIKLLVDTFYQKVKINTVIGPIFEEVVKIDWDHHMPTMYSFWSAMLLGEFGFSGNPMQKHIHLSKMTPMSSVEFSEWLSLFNSTVDELFVGVKAEDAKKRAAHIAMAMQTRIQMEDGYL